jgi:gliding motility-associated-like protein
MDNSSVGASSYEWDFGDGNSSTETNPSHTYPGEEEGNFLVQLIATSQYGCKDTAYQTVLMREELLYFVPNTFTPDDDKFNETFKPVFTSGFDPQDYTLLIFNRWGETIFVSKNANIGWDGTYIGNGDQLVSDGTYVWKIIFKTKYEDERVVEVGHVNVLK